MAKKGDIRVLVVDDEQQIAQICSHFLKRAGFDVDVAYSAEEAIDRISADDRIGIAFLDIRLPDINGVDLLKEVRRIRPTLEAIMITAHGTIQDAVKCMKRGAVDFVPKPFKRERLLAAADQAYKVQKLRAEVATLLKEVRHTWKFDGMIGKSKGMQDLFQRVTQTIETDRPILILGEPGTGKDLLARTIHYNGPQAKGPFVPVNCDALPSELIEGELFGYVKGSFEGAVRDSVGLLRSAQGGTLFLDEINTLTVGVQEKLYDYFQTGKVFPLGTRKAVSVEVRILCAADPGIGDLVEEGTFHSDLFDVVRPVTLALPSLSERKEDILLLANHFLQKSAARLNKSMKGFDSGAREFLLGASWKGNVRELEMVVEEGVINAKGKTILRENLPLSLASNRSTPTFTGVLTFREAEKIALERALEESGGNISKAARLLDTTRKRVYNLMDRHGIRS